MIYGVDRSAGRPIVASSKARPTIFAEKWAGGVPGRKVYQMPKGWRRPRGVNSERLAAAIEADGVEVEKTEAKAGKS